MCICARHEFVRANGVGDLQKGERYVLKLSKSCDTHPFFQVLQYGLHLARGACTDRPAQHFRLVRHRLSIQAQVPRANGRVTEGRTYPRQCFHGLGHPEVPLPDAQSALSSATLFEFKTRGWSNRWRRYRAELGRNEPGGKQYQRDGTGFATRHPRRPLRTSQLAEESSFRYISSSSQLFSSLTYSLVRRKLAHTVAVGDTRAEATTENFRRFLCVTARSGIRAKMDENAGGLGKGPIQIKPLHVSRCE